MEHVQHAVGLKVMSALSAMIMQALEMTIHDLVMMDFMQIPMEI